MKGGAAASAALLATLLGACAAPGSYIVLLENPGGGAGKVLVKGDKGSQTIDQVRFAAPLDGAQAPAPVESATFEKDFSQVIAARPQVPAQFLLYFESGGANLTAESQSLLAQILDEVSRRPAVDVSIIGHSDTVGRPDTNEALALQRARAVADLLQSRGMKPQALSVLSHGERNLLVTTPDETPEPRNRRVEVSVR